MFCKNCGAPVDDNATFCGSCGTRLNENPKNSQPQMNQQPNYHQPNYQPQNYQQQNYQQQNYQPQNYQQQNYQQPNYQQPNYQQPIYQQAPVAPALSMKWFKFLIYFVLWASGILNLLSGIAILSGATYDGHKDLVYKVYDGLKTVDLVTGILVIAIAIFAIITRFALANYKKAAPVLLLVVYAGNIVANLYYIIGVNKVLPAEVLSELDYTSYISSVVTAIVMIIVNYIYFKKRRHLFVR